MNGCKCTDTFVLFVVKLCVASEAMISIMPGFYINVLFYNHGSLCVTFKLNLPISNVAAGVGAEVILTALVLLVSTWQRSVL